MLAKYGGTLKVDGFQCAGTLSKSVKKFGDEGQFLYTLHKIPRPVPFSVNVTITDKEPDGDGNYGCMVEFILFGRFPAEFLHGKYRPPEKKG